jgi:hypothetical protein
MIPYDIDPSLHASEPPPERLEDGFSPPHPHPHPHAEEPAESHVEAPQQALGDKSPF